MFLNLMYMPVLDELHENVSTQYGASMAWYVGVHRDAHARQRPAPVWTVLLGLYDDALESNSLNTVALVLASDLYAKN